MDRLAEKALAALDPLTVSEMHGTVTKVLGLLVEITGFGNELSIGSIVHLRPSEDRDIPCEVVGFREQSALLMPFGPLEVCGARLQSFYPETCAVYYAL